MDGLSIIAKVNTVIKRLTIDDIDINQAGEQFVLPQGEKIAINWYRPVSRDHWEFELRSPKGGFFNWYGFKPHIEIKGNASPMSRNRLSPQVMACLDMIAWAEGTDRNIGSGVRSGYNTIFTFDRFDDFSDHPRRLKRHGGLVSDGAGRYQLLSTTWDGVARSFGLKDFSPINQDLAAAELIRRRGVLHLVEAGRIQEACDQLSFEWAAIPSSMGESRYEQPVISVNHVLNLFTQAGGMMYS